ncbi:MAG: hypothetical protein DSZ00_09520 [Gammaproteobacteria bacterium]|nr:MAG: hypothetical protein DSZ00_09520 [Gammaproteobacteria bacterium]
MKQMFVAGMALVSGLALQGCSTGGDHYYDSAAYDKDYQQYKMEKEVQRDLEKQYSPQEMHEMEKNLKKSYGK